MTIYKSVSDDSERSKAAIGANGAQSYRQMIWIDEGSRDTAAKVAIWRAAPGYYAYPACPIAETFMVMEGEADCQVAGGDIREIGPGDIVNVPINTPISLEVIRPFRKFARVVPKG